MKLRSTAALLALTAACATPTSLPSEAHTHPIHASFQGAHQPGLHPLQDLLDPADIDLNALIEQTQKGSPDPSAMTMVWWIPTEFWAASLA